MVYSAVRDAQPAAQGPSHRAEVATRAVVSVDDRRYVLDGARATIGRSKDADCVLRDPNVSRHHAELRRSAAGDWTIADLGSTNGVKVNGRRVASTRLNPGDQVTLGTTTFRFDIEHVRRARACNLVLGRARASWIYDPDLRRPQVRLPRRPLPVPALDRAQRAEGPARHGGAGAGRDRLPPGAGLRGAPRPAATPGWSRSAAAACARASAST